MRLDWIITVPQTVKWADYQLELAAAAQGAVLNYRTRYFPKEMKIGDRLFVTNAGRVRGWMEISGLVDRDEGFRCETTGVYWPAGKYIQRTGEFNAQEEKGKLYPGFRGVRRYERATLA